MASFFKLLITQITATTTITTRTSYLSSCWSRWSPRDDNRKTHLVSTDFLLDWDVLRVVTPVDSTTKAFNLFIASFRVSSDMLAKHIRNQPGSLQWQDEPGEMFNPTWYTIFFHSSISASKVLEWRRCLISTQQNNAALLSKQLIPAFCRPETSLVCLFLSLFEFSAK